MGIHEDNLAAIRAEALALQEKLRALDELARKEREIIAIEEKQKELEKPVVIKCDRISGLNVIVRMVPWRQDVLDYLKATPGRSWNGDSNMIPLKSWENFAAGIVTLQNVTLECSDALKEQINFILNAPNWSIDIDERAITIAAGPNTAGTYQVENFFSGAKRDHNSMYLKLMIPLSEAWRVPEAFTHERDKWNGEKQQYEKVVEYEPGVHYSDAAQEFIAFQIEMRAKLDEIAKLPNAPEIQEILNRLGFNGTLREFQQVGVKFLMHTTGRAILADQVGLGKTWQAIAYALLSNAQKILVVCPASLKPNWEWQIKERCGEEALVLSGGNPAMFAVDLVLRPRRFTIMNYDIMGKKVKRCPDCHSDDINEPLKGGYNWFCRSCSKAFTTPETIFPWADFLVKCNFDLVIFDEAHYIKNTDSNRSQAARRYVEFANPARVLPMTGSPVMNRPEELWPLLKLTSPLEFESEEKFIAKYTYQDKKTPRDMDTLHAIIKPFFIRRKKADVQKDLPPINYITEYHELSKKAQKIYEKILAGLWEQIPAYSPTGQGGDDINIISMLAMLVRMKQVCAIDKAPHTADLVTDIVDSAEATNGHDKVLVYTQFKAVAYNIYSRLRDVGAICLVDRVAQEGKRAAFVTADYEERFARIQQFQNDPAIRVMVATSGALREGLDVTAAGTIVWNDLLWTPAAHDQGEGRAYGRLGDEHSIDSHYVVAQNTIEDDILKIHATKRALVEKMIETVDDARVSDQGIVRELINRLRAQRWSK